MDLTCPFCQAPNTQCTLVGTDNGGGMTIMCMHCQIAAVLDDGMLRLPRAEEYPSIVNDAAFILAFQAFGMMGIPLPA